MLLLIKKVRDIILPVYRITEELEHMYDRTRKIHFAFS